VSKPSAESTPPVLPIAEATELLRRELASDIGSGDVTSEIVVPEGSQLTARLIAREEAVLCGVELFALAFRLVSEAVECRLEAADGARMAPGDVAAEVAGPARAVLSAERTALNVVCHLSGIATLSSRFVEAVRGTGAAILDTRKTLPGLRGLQKYAVAVGGGVNHRMGLHEMVLIKDNHVAVAARPPADLARTAASESHVPVEVEIDSVDDLPEALSSGADYILLDNFSTADLERSVEIARRFATEHGSRPELEASGGVELDTVRAVAATGVDRISVGALTHSARAADFGLDFVLCGK